MPLYPTHCPKISFARAESVGVPNALMSLEGIGHESFIEDPVIGPQVIRFANEFLYSQLDLAQLIPDSIAGDFTFDGLLTSEDIDLLTIAVNSEPTQLSFDLNNDNQVTEDDRVMWIKELKNTFFGDANLDGEFNSSDLTHVFTSAEYEDSIAFNSTWTTGDWNGDGDFNTGDFVAAFKDGGYEQGTRATQLVPEPSSLVGLSIGLLMVATTNIGRRRCFR